MCYAVLFALSADKLALHTADDCGLTPPPSNSPLFPLRGHPSAKKNKQSQRSGGLAKLLRSQGATQQGAERSQGRGASRRGSANARGITVDDLPSQALVG